MAYWAMPSAARLARTGPEADRCRPRLRCVRSDSRGAFTRRASFINFKFTTQFLWQWLERFSTASDYQSGAGDIKHGRTVVIDYPSANTAKQAHIGHLRPMVIGEAIARLLDFCGAETVRDNHIGDWGTNFGTLIMKIKRDGIDLATLGDNALAALDQFRDGSALEKEEPALRDVSRMNSSSCKKATPRTLRCGNRSSTSPCKPRCTLRANGRAVDKTLGESFYRDKVDRVYAELTDAGLAESDGALVVWHDEVKKFARDGAPLPLQHPQA